MEKKLFLLDGMALVYRAHFALIARPIFTSKGVNTSALYGFTQTLLDILNTHKPTHIAVAFDTDAPTARHKEFADYKSQREAMPEDISLALPNVRRLLQAFRIPILECDGCEADDIIGTLVKAAEKQSFQSFMVTPDKDFGQLVTDKIFVYKPSRMGDGVEIMGIPQILNRWGIQRPEQVIDILGLMGDTSDNIPGVPGIGEKTASKLIQQFGTIEQIYARLVEVKGKLKETLTTYKEQALLSKRLATLQCDAPVSLDIERLRLQPRDDDALKALFIEFEFNTIGRRLYGDEFKAGRGFEAPSKITPKAAGGLELHDAPAAPVPVADLKRLADLPHTYRIVQEPAERRQLLDELGRRKTFAIAIQCSPRDPKQACPSGFAVAFEPGKAFFIPVEKNLDLLLQELKPLLQDEKIEKVGHNLKHTLSVLRWHGICGCGRFFDTMLAHALIEPDMRHTLSYLAEALLGYSPLELSAEGDQLLMEDSSTSADRAMEEADLALQLRARLEPALKEKGQERVFFEIETQLVPALVDMEYEGIRVDAKALAEFGQQLARDMAACEKEIYSLAGTEFNLNSPKQLGEILFEKLKLVEGAKKTKTGQYATSEQILQELAGEHPIVQRILDYRTASKLKSTYADTLPTTIWSKSGRVHTTYNQAVTTTGRLNSQDPNLQNIPIRTEQGREIRRAFIPRSPEYTLLAADYSQIELRIIAAISKEEAMIEAFNKKQDIHTATAARVFGVAYDGVTAEMRRKAKMVNFGIAYGISAFGLAQRLGIPRREGAEIIDQYFKTYPRIRNYMSETIEFCREHGYVETVTGRRRYLRDIRSSNATIRAAAERNAINAPIQGTAADMIKIAMARIYQEICQRGLKTRMLLQVHDELVFDLFKPEEAEVKAFVEEKMKTAIPLEVPIEIEMGTGENWLEAH